MNRTLASLAIALACTSAFAQTAKEPSNFEMAGIRTGHGQDSPKDPPMLKNLRLNDPLIQQKYLNDPDMIRFLRGMYTEACARGLVVDAAEQVKQDVKRQHSEEARKAAASLLEGKRLWRMGSFELEALVGGGYLNAANYCECIMKDVTDTDLVNPKKGLDAVEKIPKSVQNACERNAQEATLNQLEERKRKLKKN